MLTEIRTSTADEMNGPHPLPLVTNARNDWEKYLTPAEIAALAKGERGQMVEEGDTTNRVPQSLPQCPETMRVIPSALLRSALFGIVRRGTRKYIAGETLTAWKGASIAYKGEQLDQYDLDVWLQVLHIVRQQNSAVARAHFTARGFLKAIGRKVSGTSTKVLFNSLRRMVACAVTVTLNGRSFTGSLLEEIDRDEHLDLYVVRLNPKLCRLFDTGYTRLSWETRLTLPTDLSRWLHGYILSHQATLKAPHRIAVGTLYALTGSSAAALRSFRQILRQSMIALEQANVVWKWRITDKDALEFVRPSSSV